MKILKITAIILLSLLADTIAILVSISLFQNAPLLGILSLVILLAGLYEIDRRLYSVFLKVNSVNRDYEDAPMRTLEERLQNYTDDDFSIRYDIEQEFDAILDGRNEDNPLKCEICLEPRDACGMSSLEMPWVTAIWKDSKDSDICFEIDERSKRYFVEMETYELATIIKELNT